MHSSRSRRIFLKGLLTTTFGAGLAYASTALAEEPVLDKKSFLPFIAASATPKPPDPPVITDIIFLHHSTGDNLIHQGGVRPLFAAKGYDFWDHDYNGPGLSLPSGSSAGYNYNVPGDNTNPDGFNVIFQQEYFAEPVHPQPPQNCFSGLMRHQVIAFKSCFPASAITSDTMLEQYKTYYRAIRARADQFPDRIFIPFSTPPLHTCSTNENDAARARAFSTWLKSSEYLSGHPNLFVFDFFDLLARPDDGDGGANMLRPDYSPSGCDSHPNQLANQTIGPIFVDFVDVTIKEFVN